MNKKEIYFIRVLKTAVMPLKEAFKFQPFRLEDYLPQEKIADAFRNAGFNFAPVQSRKGYAFKDGQITLHLTNYYENNRQAIQGRSRANFIAQHGFLGDLCYEAGALCIEQLSKIEKLLHDYCPQISSDKEV